MIDIYFSCRDSFESLCQEAQTLIEGGHGSGSELRVSAQLQMQQQTLLKAVRERLRSCQLSLQEQQSFDETLQTTWAWLSNIQERLTALSSTTGNKETLEKRLGLVQVSNLITIHSSLITRNCSIEKTVCLCYRISC